MYAAISPCLLMNHEVTYENFLKVRQLYHCMVALTIIASIAAVISWGAFLSYNKAFVLTNLQDAITLSLCAISLIFMGLTLGYKNTSKLMLNKLNEEESENSKESNLSSKTKV